MTRRKLLSPYWTSNCVLISGYTSGVTFGAALRAIRGDLTGPELAVLALGRDLPQQKYRDFANYLSKIELDKVPNVGLARLRLIATGLGFTTLSSFFAEIESRTTGHGTGRATAGGSPRGSRSVQAKTEQRDTSLESEIGHAFVNIWRRVAGEQAPTADPARPSRGKTHRKNR